MQNHTFTSRIEKNYLNSQTHLCQYKHSIRKQYIEKIKKGEKIITLSINIVPDILASSLFMFTDYC